MVRYGLVKFIFNTTFVKTCRSLGNIEIFQVGLNIFVVLYINLLLQAEVVLDHFFLVKRWLLDAKVVHDEEITCLWFIDTDSIDVIKVGNLTMDDVSKMIALIKYVITRVYKHLNFVSDSYFQGYQENLFLLV